MIAALPQKDQEKFHEEVFFISLLLTAITYALNSDVNDLF
jgi:hypothetical protein